MGRSDLPDAGVTPLADADAIITPVILEHLSVAMEANQRVHGLRARLQNASFRIVMAGCTYLVLGFTSAVVVLQHIDTPPHVGFRKNVTRKLIRRLLARSQIILQFRQHTFNRHLISLGLVELLVELQKQFFGCQEVGFGTTEDLLDIIDDLCRRQQTAEALAGQGNDLSNINHRTSISHRDGGGNA